jgi:hypothetical protein
MTNEVSGLVAGSLLADFKRRELKERSKAISI